MAVNAEQADLSSGLAEFADELSQSLEELAARPANPIAPGIASPVTQGSRVPYFAASSPVPKNSDLDAVIRDIPVTLKVVLGTAKMPVAEISKMTRGTVIKLDSKVGDPVDIYANGRFVARGQVVVLDDEPSRFGVTLTHVGGHQNSKR